MTILLVTLLYMLSAGLFGHMTAVLNNLMHTLVCIKLLKHTF